MSEGAEKLRAAAEAFDRLWDEASGLKENIAEQINEIYEATGADAPQPILDQVAEIKDMMNKIEEIQTSCNGVRDGLNAYCESVGY
jgi:hypothetical protein